VENLEAVERGEIHRIMIFMPADGGNPADRPRLALLKPMGEAASLASQYPTRKDFLNGMMRFRRHF
jgi:hypothetical protein